MRALALDFLRPAGPSRTWAAALLLTGAVALGTALLHAARQKTEGARLAATLADSERSARGGRQALGPASTGADEATRQELARAQQIVDTLNIGWGQLFAQLEGRRVPGATLLAVQREAGNSRRLRLTGQARRLDDALAYVSRLATTPGFANVHLVAHEASAEGERTAVQFVLLADWVAPP